MAGPRGGASRGERGSAESRRVAGRAVGADGWTRTRAQAAFGAADGNAVTRGPCGPHPVCPQQRLLGDTGSESGEGQDRPTADHEKQPHLQGHLRLTAYVLPSSPGTRHSFGQDPSGCNCSGTSQLTGSDVGEPWGVLADLCPHPPKPRRGHLPRMCPGETAGASAPSQLARGHPEPLLSPPNTSAKSVPGPGDPERRW